MVRFFNKVFNIRTHEWPRLLLLYLIFFMIITSSAWGRTIVEAAFLEYVGVKFLPGIFVVNAIFSIIAMAIYTAFADRVANDKLLIVILVISIIGIAIGLVVLEWGLVAIAYPLLYLTFFVVLVDIFNLHAATYLNGLYDTQTAKRIVPVVISASRMAGIVAGLTMPHLNYLLSPNGIITVWLGTLVVATLILWLTPRILKEDKTASEQPEYITLSTVAGTGKRHPSYIDNIREGYHYVSLSSFLRWMALSTLLLTVLLAFLNYQVSYILLAEFQTTKNISNFTGILSGVANLVMLPVQLFLLSRIIGRIGLGNANLTFPTGTLAICGGLIFLPGIPTAALAYLDRIAFRNLHYTIDSLLYNAVPLRVKGRARAFIGGFITPIGALVGGGLLLLLPFISVAWFLPGLIGVLAMAFMISALVIRKQYIQALITMLEQEDFSFLLSQEASDLTVTDPTTLNQLRKRLEESTSHELTVFMAKLISQVGGSKAIPILGPAARAAEDARTRLAIVDVLVAADLHGDAIRQLYTDFLADPDGQVRQSAIAGLEQLAGPTDKQFISQMLEMVHDPDINVGIQVLSAFARSGDFYQFTSAVQVLDQLLADEDPHRRARGVRVLGQVGNHRTIRDLIEYLTDPADQVRLEAAVAVEELSQDVLSNLKAIGGRIDTLIVEKMSHLLQDPVERVRQAALVVLGRMGTRESHQALVDALTDPSPQVRATAVDTLARVGKSVIPIVHPKLDSPDPQLRKMVAVTLSRVNPREFGGLIVGKNIMGNLLAIYSNCGLVEALVPCSGYPSIAVLQSALREQNQQFTDEIFYLLAAIHDLGAVKIISESLRSESAHTRANAAEALESLTTPQTAHLIAPLFEPELPPSQLLSISEDTWEMEHPDTAQAIQQLATHPDDPWLRTIMTFALGEIGAALREGAKGTTGSPDREQAEGGEQKRRKGRRSPPSDLFGALIDTAEAEADTSPNLPFTLSEIGEMLDISLADPVDEVRLAAQSAKRVMGGLQVTGIIAEEGILLSTIEKIIFLKEVPFFQGMTIDQLKVLASVCEEEMFEEDAKIFSEGDPGGALYVVVNGRVGIEREKRKGSFARVATLGAHSYFGETSLFEGSPRTASAIAIQDTLTLRLRREPLIALARQYPGLSLELINVLSARLRQANARIAELTRTRPRELHRLYDQFD